MKISVMPLLRADKCEHFDEHVLLVVPTVTYA